MIIDSKAFGCKDHGDLKIKMLNWANRFSIFCLLDNNGYSFENPAFECMLGAGCVRSFTFTPDKSFSSLQSFFDDSPSWLFGHLGYNAAGNAYSGRYENNTDFGPGFFFEPEIILRLAGDKMEIMKSNVSTEQLIKNIRGAAHSLQHSRAVKNIVAVISRDQYLQDIAKLKEHIRRGDCYEINYCQQFIAEGAAINPVTAYMKLTSLSPAPFGAFYKFNEQYCLCASPERFLKKTGRTLLSQPIKGTAKRDLLNREKDEENKMQLLKSEKEKSENVMIVDLVRNDMSMVCKKESVRVTELFGMYSFPQVHQMISRIEGEMEEKKSFTVAIEACYPMGSMTGAPKKKVMELIEKYERNARGLFSGSIGYITPTGDFDFNVVIRSIFYNSLKKQVSFFAGGGITFYSNAEEEYEECMAKAEAIFRVLDAD